jgi:hypothetical protein
MLRTSLAAVALSGLFIVGCSEDETGTPETLQDTAQKAGNEASNALDKVQDRTEDATDAAQNRANDVNNNAAENTAEATQKAINDLIDKAKDAAENRRWAEAKGFLSQIDTVKSRLPAADQTRVDQAMAEVRKLIDAGEKLAPAGATNNQN